MNNSGYTKQFRNHVLSYENYSMAFDRVQREEDFCSCFKRNNQEYHLDVELIKDLLGDFIYSRNTSKKLRMVQNPLENCHWGLEACEHIVDDCNEGFDLRYFYALSEYVMLMKQRVQRVTEELLISDQGLYEKLVDLEKKFRLLLNLTIKYNVQKQALDHVEVVKNKLNELLAEEKEILLVFYKMLGGGR